MLKTRIVQIKGRFRSRHAWEEYRVLRALQIHGPLSRTDLGRVLRMRQGRLQYALERLEDDGDVMWQLADPHMESDGSFTARQHWQIRPQY